MLGAMRNVALSICVFYVESKRYSYTKVRFLVSTYVEQIGLFDTILSIPQKCDMSLCYNGQHFSPSH